LGRGRAWGRFSGFGRYETADVHVGPCEGGDPLGGVGLGEWTFSRTVPSSISLRSPIHDGPASIRYEVGKTASRDNLSRRVSVSWSAQICSFFGDRRCVVAVINDGPREGPCSGRLRHICPKAFTLPLGNGAGGRVMSEVRLPCPERVVGPQR
jgi:hypothetical protein